MMERTLEQAFCALVGSKFAAVVAAGQDVAWLIDYCKALVQAHSELPGEDRQAILDALVACRAANDPSHCQLVHSIHFPQRRPQFPVPRHDSADREEHKAGARRHVHLVDAGVEMRKVAGDFAGVQIQLLDRGQRALGKEGFAAWRGTPESRRGRPGRLARRPVTAGIVARRAQAELAHRAAGRGCPPPRPVAGSARVTSLRTCISVPGGTSSPAPVATVILIPAGLGQHERAPGAVHLVRMPAHPHERPDGRPAGQGPGPGRSRCASTRSSRPPRGGGPPG